MIKFNHMHFTLSVLFTKWKQIDGEYVCANVCESESLFEIVTFQIERENTITTGNLLTQSNDELNKSLYAIAS